LTSSAIAAVMDRFINDASFRGGMQRNPEETLHGSGLSLSNDEVAAVLNTDWAGAGEELSARVSKGFTSN
jgi:hypothetical protein